MTAQSARPTLAELGSRICILGPSNTGKSTLADAIAREHGLPPVHLDQLHHLPGTDWQRRPEAEFAALHHAAVIRRCWFDRNRRGTLEGASHRVRWAMLHHIALVAPRNWPRYDTVFDETMLPKLCLSTRQLAAFYRAERLTP